MRLVYCCLWLLSFVGSSGCAKQTVLQRSVSMEAYRMDEQTNAIFVETNPHSSSFSIVLGPIDRGECTAFAKFYGFKGRQEYLLFCPNTGDSLAPVAMHSLVIEEACVIETHDGIEEKKNAFELRIPAVPGFRSTWYLWSTDDAIRLSQKVVARPLQMAGSDGATLTIIRKESGGNFVEACASGLSEGEQVCLIFRSLGAQWFYPVKTSSTGKVRLPFISSLVGVERGIMAGTTSVLLVRQSETLELSYEWDLSTTQRAAKKS